MSLVTTSKGDILLEFHYGTELDIPPYDQHIPIPLALVIPKYQGKTLMIFNRWREEWELPGGKIEDDETPHDAAVRELAEETGQIVESVDYVGWMKFRLKPDDRLELGVLYTCILNELQSFKPNDEASKIGFWDEHIQVYGHVNEIDVYLAQLVK